jgi:thiamine-phosphate pyrophosphorylase
MHNFGLYIVMTAPELGYRAFTEICVQEEVGIIQLRDKTMPNLDLIALARELTEITKNSQTLFIINDRVDQCIVADADGVHLGPDDTPWQQARALLPEGKLIGVSTHSIEAAEALISTIKNPQSIKAPDYMSFGPIFPTVAKKIPDPPVGSEQLRYVLSIAPIPVVAIGGIFPHNLQQVCHAGAKNIGMIRHFGDSSSPAELSAKIREFKQALKEQTP